MPRPRADGRPPRKTKKVRINDRFIKDNRKKIKAQPEKTRAIFYDRDLKGFALQVEPTGHMSYKLLYRYGGRPRWFNIGDVRALAGAEAARRIVRELNAKMVLDAAFDPQAGRVAMRAAGTFREHLDEYLGYYAQRHPKSWAHVKWTLVSVYLPKWRNLKTETIGREDVKRIFAAQTQRAPKSANQALAHVSAFFNWAKREGKIPERDNPCRDIERNPTKDRERVLDDDELPRFWRAFDDLGTSGRALKTLLLIGQRPGEVCHMRWEDIKRVTINLPPALQARLKEQGLMAPKSVGGSIWTLRDKPSADWDPIRKHGSWPGTKNGRTHDVWLPTAVLELIGDGPNEGPVFAGRGGHSIRTLAREMSRVCRDLGIVRDDMAKEEWSDAKVTPHDLRRTHGTTVTGLGFTSQQMDRLQNHAEGGIAKVYDRHGYRQESWEIQTAVAEHIAGLVAGVPEDEAAELVGE